jgi:APA family basic amino acid/polyamine antiporter
MLALGAFIALALPAFDAQNFQPFMPYGFPSSESPDGTKQGVMAAAALIFFAFYGFDAVSTAAEETRNPGRDLKIGIIGSMALCTLIYMAVGAAALGAAPYEVFSRSNEPLAFIMRSLQHPWAATVVAGAAVVALPTVILAFMYGQSRIFFVMARDGLLPRPLSRVNRKSGTPVVMTLLTGLIVAVIAGFLPLRDIAELANAGTLCAFIAVALCMLVLRLREPRLARVFKAPWPWLIGPLAIVGCAYLFWSLPELTVRRFLIWNLIGLAVYLIYARRRSRLR